MVGVKWGSWFRGMSDLIDRSCGEVSGFELWAVATVRGQTTMLVGHCQPMSGFGDPCKLKVSFIFSNDWGKLV